MDYRERAKEIIVGAYDLHTHTNPSHLSRQLTDIELLKDADELKMSGVMYKFHRGATECRAYLANITANAKYCKAYGGLTLCNAVGGFNPAAVEASAKLGTKMIWMPTLDAKNHIAFHNSAATKYQEPLSVFDRNGNLLPEIYDIFDVVKSYNIHLATGHLSPEEGVAVCKEGLKQGVKMIFTHPDWHATLIDIETQKELADAGVKLEKLWAPVSLGEKSAEFLADSLKTLGTKNVFMATDHGISSLARPNIAIVDCIAAMLENGVSEDALKVLWRNNPQEIVES